MARHRVRSTLYIYYIPMMLGLSFQSTTFFNAVLSPETAIVMVGVTEIEIHFYGWS